MKRWSPLYGSLFQVHNYPDLRRAVFDAGRNNAEINPVGLSRGLQLHHQLDQDVRSYLQDHADLVRASISWGPAVL
jgi:hypothetical protein